MQLSVLSLAVLKIYRYLEPMAISIDRQIATKSYNPECSIGFSMEKTTGEIIGLTERKIALINLKVLIDKAIAKLNDNNKKIIILKYIDNLSVNEICELLSVSQRTYFRKSNAAIDAFCRMFAIQNSLHGDILSKYQKQKWFVNMTGFFDSVENEKKDNQLFVCDYLLKNVKHIC